MYLEYAGGPLGGDPEFIKSAADSSWFFPVFWDTVFMIRGRIGYAGSLIDKPLPVGERFFVGGPLTVRGFKYGTAGPMEPVTDESGNITDYQRIGGNKELVFNAEYTFPVIPAAHMNGVLFYDIGKAFDDHERIRYHELRHSCGWGFRWITPIGPLRFEWGYVINDRPEDKKSLFEFYIGTFF